MFNSRDYKLLQAYRKQWDELTKKNNAIKSALLLKENISRLKNSKSAKDKEQVKSYQQQLDKLQAQFDKKAVDELLKNIKTLEIKFDAAQSSPPDHIDLSSFPYSKP